MPTFATNLKIHIRHFSQNFHNILVFVIGQIPQQKPPLLALQLSVLLQRFNLSLKQNKKIETKNYTNFSNTAKLYTFFEIKCLRLSSFICGNCNKGDLCSQSPCVIIGHNFMQFSIVSILGNLWTKSRFKLNHKINKFNAKLFNSLRLAYASKISWLTQLTISWIRYGHLPMTYRRSTSSVLGGNGIRDKWAWIIALAFMLYE